MIAARALARRAAPLRSYMTASELRAGVAAGDVETVMVMMHDLYGRPMGKLFDADFFLADALGHGTHACNYLAAVDMAMDPVDGYAGFGYAEGYGDFHLAPDLATLRVLVDAVDAAGLGGANVASELEYFIYADSYKAAHAKGHSNLEPIGQYVEDYHLLQGARTEFYHRRVRRALKAAGMVVETSKGEAAKGQHELNVRYDGALAMADNHVVFKQCLKEIADQENISVTFMAKPSADEPGSSFYAPTVNAYKRYQSKSWAPTALVWSADNRTAGFRVVGSGEALRVEMRIPGADANPYLAFAAVLASGLAGDASAAFKASAFARGAFGDVVVDHYATFFDNEVLAFERAVTDFEMRRYFEQMRSLIVDGDRTGRVLPRGELRGDVRRALLVVGTGGGA
ncbi:hypothetical protein JL722_1797 [Aureococcus anophagefferens]|nr:hypothetical protein JL722_1797 [Aureococcus anophagefferens]